MANITKTTKAAGMKAAKKAKAGDPVPDYVLQDNQDGSFTINGADAQGATVDISAVATLAVTSSDDTIVSVDPPAGMNVACHALKPGSASLEVTATWNDGSVGPFTITVPVTSTAGPATGLIVEFGVPTIR